MSVQVPHLRGGVFECCSGLLWCACGRHSRLNCHLIALWGADGMCMRADALGTVGLLFCLAAGSGYQQPPLRSVRREAAKDQEPLLLKKEPKKETIV